MVRHLGGPGFNLQCHHQLLINGVSLGLHFILRASLCSPSGWV